MKQSTIVKNRERAKQILAFDGMQYGKCRPTDIDVAMDWQGKTFVFVELKGAGAPLTLGQKIHLTSLVDAIVAGGRKAYAILAHHDTPNCSHDVHVAESSAHSIYSGGNGWTKLPEGVKLDILINKLHRQHEERNQ